MVSGELEKSLRKELEGYVNSRLSAIQDEVVRLQSQVNEAFTRLLERAASETQVDTSVAATISEHLRAAHEGGIEQAAVESARAKSASDMALIKAAIDDIDNQRSQADILNSLVNRAASFAPRVAFFIIKNEQATGWRARGLEGTIGDDTIRTIALPLSAATPLSNAANSRATWSGAPGANAEDYLLLNKLGGEPPQRIVTVPLVVRGKAVAVLYADSAGLDSDAINLEAIETLVRVAGMAVGLLAVSRIAPSGRLPHVEPQVFAPQPEPPAQPAQPEEPPAQPVQEPQVAVEEEPQAQPVEQAGTAPSGMDITIPAPAPMVEADEGDRTHLGRGRDTVIDRKWTPPGFDLQQPVEATEQPAPTNFGGQAEAQPVPAATGQFAAPLGGERRFGAEVELPVDVSDEERRLHNDARRFARLLVSEIKLYNEQKVKEGRQEGDLYKRLREDIDRSRQMYDKRVAPPVAARFDYFHHELVSTLAEGDPAKLGNGYPGATVSA